LAEVLGHDFEKMLNLESDTAVNKFYRYLKRVKEATKMDIRKQKFVHTNDFSKWLKENIGLVKELANEDGYEIKTVIKHSKSGKGRKSEFFTLEEIKTKKTDTKESNDTPPTEPKEPKSRFNVDGKCLGDLLVSPYKNWGALSKYFGSFDGVNTIGYLSRCAKVMLQDESVSSSLLEKSIFEINEKLDTPLKQDVVEDIIKKVKIEHNNQSTSYD
jgi:hypothetical protein